MPVIDTEKYLHLIEKSYIKCLGKVVKIVDRKSVV